MVYTHIVEIACDRIDKIHDTKRSEGQLLANFGAAVRGDTYCTVGTSIQLDQNGRHSMNRSKWVHNHLHVFFTNGYQKHVYFLGVFEVDVY